MKPIDSRLSRIRALSAIAILGAAVAGLPSCAADPDGASGPGTDSASANGGGAGSSARPHRSPPSAANVARHGETVQIPVKNADGKVSFVPMKNDHGRAVLGDMDFGDVDDMKPRAISPNDLGLRWPLAKVRYYVETADEDTRLTATQHLNLLEAIEYIEARTPIRFEQGTTGDLVYIYRDIDDPGASHSKIGRLGGTQDLRLGINASEPVTIVHELSHALGMIHEQERPDRDVFITYCEDNVEPGREGNFTTVGLGSHDMFGPYDFHSMMHYRPGTFVQTTDMSQCGGLALEPKIDTYPDAPGDRSFGRKDDYSAEDLNALYLMYGRALTAPEADDVLGSALAIGDFDHDGYADIVTGAPGKSLQGDPDNAGAILAFKGTHRGPAAWKTNDKSPFALKDEWQGKVLATGDFDGDGYTDLLVGKPGGSSFDKRSGTVTVLHGGQRLVGNESPKCGTAGATPCSTEHAALTAWEQLVPSDCPGQTDADGDLFGSAIVAGDFDGDGLDDIAVGAPGRAGGEGRVFVYSGASIKDKAPKSVMLAGTVKKGVTSFGAALAIGDFNNDNDPDLAVGAPDEGNGRAFLFRAITVENFTAQHAIDAPSGIDAGEGFGSVLLAPKLAGRKKSAFLAVGSPRARSLRGQVDLYAPEDTSSFLLVHKQKVSAGNDYAGLFGTALATLDLDGDGITDLVVGAPKAGTGDRGSVQMLKSNGATVAHWNHVFAPTTNTLMFGAALATGTIHGPMPPSPVPDPPTRLLVGAPGTSFLDPITFVTIPNAGRVYGYAFVPGPAQREILAANYRSQFVAD